MGDRTQQALSHPALHTLRRQLSELPAESASHSEVELELREQIAALRRATGTTLEALKRTRAD